MSAQSILNRRSLLASAASLFAVGCQSLPSPSTESPVQDRVIGDYRLGPGDQVRLVVFGEAELSGEFVVSGAGVISVPLIGDVPAQGRTVAEVQRAVEEALRSRYILDPQVSAEVLTYRPFYVLGEVNRPGTYPYASGLTVLNAVATAGGFTYRADTRRVFIRRDGSTAEEAYLIGPTLQVAPGDTIRIAERLF